MNLNVGLIGYGEVRKIFSKGLKAKGLSWVGARDVMQTAALGAEAHKARALSKKLCAIIP